MSDTADPPYDVFLSYSRADAEIAQPLSREIARIAAELPSGPWRVFFDTSELHGGDTWYRRIMHAVGACRTFVALLSPTYLDSRMCMKEWDAMATRSLGSADALMYPLMGRDCALPPDMQMTQWHDFRGLDPGSDGFTAVVAKLVADLDRIVVKSRPAAVPDAAPAEVARAAGPDRDIPGSARALLRKLEEYVAAGDHTALTRGVNALGRILGETHALVEQWRPLLDAFAPPPPEPVSRFKAIDGFTLLPERDRVSNDVPVYRSDAFAGALGLSPGQGDPAAEFVLIPAGEFVMGAPAGEAMTGEVPLTPCQIRKPFLLARTAVCQRAWRELVGSTGLDAEPAHFEGDRRPVEQVSWDDVTSWCEANGLRLPSESEWEYACRAGTTGPFWFGSMVVPSQVNCAVRSPDGGAAQGDHPERTANVGALPANAFGLFEVHGNVWEWCQDSWHDDHRGHPGTESARATTGVLRRVRRGGGWLNNASHCRSASRGGSTAGYSRNWIGFRPAKIYD
jgi:formylglycine-generating enzyme required for sulfatase activity